MSVSGENVVQK